MKTIILCAGVGSRLKAVSNGKPKCMIEISGKPLIDYLLNDLHNANIKDIFINLHYNPESIKSYLGDGLKYNMRITYSFEKKLLGTAGALNNFKKYIDDDFIVIYGDTYRELDFSDMIAYYRKSGVFGLIALHTPDNPFDSGIVKLNNKFKIIEFIEKPPINTIPANNLYSNAGVYIFNKQIFEYIIPETFSDFGIDIFPKLIKEQELIGYPIKGTVIDIGIPERLERLREYSVKMR